MNRKCFIYLAKGTTLKQIDKNDHIFNDLVIEQTRDK